MLGRIIGLIFLIGVGVVSLSACNSSSDDEVIVNPPEPPVIDNPPWPENADVMVDFRDQDHGIEFDFIYYPEGERDQVEADLATVLVPESEDYEGYAQRLFWQSDVDFAPWPALYFVVKADGLTPGGSYEVTYTAEVLTQDTSGSYDGGGGGPQIRGGLFNTQPVEVTTEDDMVTLQIDDRELDTSIDTVVVGHIELPEGLGGDWRIKRITNDVEGYSAEANMDGEAWILILVRTGHVGYNDFYMTRVAIELEEY